MVENVYNRVILGIEAIQDQVKGVVFGFQGKWYDILVCSVDRFESGGVGL